MSTIFSPRCKLKRFPDVTLNSPPLVSFTLFLSWHLIDSRYLKTKILQSLFSFDLCARNAEQRSMKIYEELRDGTDRAIDESHPQQINEKSMNFLRFRDLEAGDCLWSSARRTKKTKNVGQTLARNSDENFLIKSFNLYMDSHSSACLKREKEFTDSLKRSAANTNLLFERLFRVPTNQFGAFYGNDEFLVSFQRVSMSSKTFTSWENQVAMEGSCRSCHGRLFKIQDVSINCSCKKRLVKTCSAPEVF